MQLKKNIKGDTIIEVLVCLAILGFVMTLAYTISTKSLQTIRRAQERVEALKIAEGQVELLKDMQKNRTTDFINAADRDIGQPFCLNNAGTVIPFNVPADHSWDEDLSLDTLNYPNNGPNQKCKDLSASGTGAGLYNVAIVAPDDPDGGTFKVYVRWLRLGGGVNDQVTMEYRLYVDN
jgi:type II secretory pathway pseudopilin PulG